MLHEMDICALIEKEPDFSVCDVNTVEQILDTPEQVFHSEHSRFEYPSWIWGTMAACYVIFFVALTIATGRDLATLFMIGISIAYTVMYFGTSTILAKLNAQPDGKKAGYIKTIDTWTGKFSVNEAAAQILTVPAMLAFFAVGIVIIRAAVF